MTFFPRAPVRFIPIHSELLSNQMQSRTIKQDPPNNPDHVPTARMESHYNAPAGRVLGNQLFRRMPSGELDLDAAKHVIIDIIHKVKDQGPLTELEKTALGCIFPLMFPFVDARLVGPLTRVQLRLTPSEVDAIAQAVAAHLTAEMSYNAGRGGGGDPGRAVTRS